MAKKKIGRPRKFETPEKLQKKIDGYFKKCDKEGTPYTVTGLALDLDCDRATLCRYEKKEEFSHTVKMAKLRVEAFLELLLLTSSRVSGVIFNLKNNFGWNDRQKLKRGDSDKIPASFEIHFVEPKKQA